MTTGTNRQATRNDFKRALPMLQQLNFAKYCPSIVGLIGSNSMVSQLLERIQIAIWNKSIDEALQLRLEKMLRQHVPQIASFNGMKIEELEIIPSKEELKKLFENASLEKKELGENLVFLRVIYHSIRILLEPTSS